MIIIPAPSTVLSDPEHRYALVAQKLLGCKNILDVGGYDDRRHLITKIIGNDFQYTAINNSSAWYGAKAKSLEYDGVKLPFIDNQFEVAISVDTLEHIPPECRAEFVAEMIRVSQRIILVTPFSDPSRSTMEPAFAKISQKFGVEIKPSIIDHIEKGLPTLKQIEECLINEQYTIEFGTDFKKFWQMIFLQLAINIIARSRSKNVNKLIKKIFANKLHSKRSLKKSMAYRAIISTH